MSFHVSLTLDLTHYHGPCRSLLPRFSPFIATVNPAWDSRHSGLLSCGRKVIPAVVTGERSLHSPLGLCGGSYVSSVVSQFATLVNFSHENGTINIVVQTFETISKLRKSWLCCLYWLGNFFSFKNRIFSYNIYECFQHNETFFQHNLKWVVLLYFFMKMETSLF